MPLMSEHEQLVVYIDQQVNQILSNDGDHTALLLSLADIIEDLKKLIDSTKEEEMDKYCQQYPGFYRFMQLVEEMAFELSEWTPLTYQ